jgi:AmiR/NasT family two-component response regulator
VTHDPGDDPEMWARFEAQMVRHDLINQAIGFLMVRRGLDVDDALLVLVQQSLHRGTTIYEAARRTLDGTA